MITRGPKNAAEYEDGALLFDNIEREREAEEADRLRDYDLDIPEPEED